MRGPRRSPEALGDDLPIHLLARLGIQVRIRRNQLGLTREELSVESKVPHTMIAVIEAAARPDGMTGLSLGSLLRIASALKVHPAWLFTAPEAGSDAAEDLALALLDHFHAMSPALQAGLVEIAATLADQAELA